ncbi:MAG TPA: hypothetical protein VLE27_05715 [Thermoanaerobaculia bacterium]|nr:hypothetical protein [Thermoanaerobaculia bacterium]
MRAILTATLLIPSLLAAGPSAAQTGEANPCPLHAQHQALDDRGDKVMGFGHTRTTHRFLLEKDGGVIQVETNDPKDAGSLGQIRSHLVQVAEAFSRGDFSMPKAIHDRVLPGVPEMTRLKSEISYRYEETASGARVHIKTASSEALAAVHEFLRAQIGDHRTGDPLHTAGHH